MKNVSNIDIIKMTLINNFSVIEDNDVKITLDFAKFICEMIKNENLKIKYQTVDNVHYDGITKKYIEINTNVDIEGYNIKVYYNRCEFEYNSKIYFFTTEGTEYITKFITDYEHIREYNELNDMLKMYFPKI